MNFLFVSGYAHLPQRFGGLESNTDEFCRELITRGHSGIVAAGLLAAGYIGIKTRILGKLQNKRTLYDRHLGYPTYRRWNVRESLSDIVAQTAPDVAIVQPRDQVPLAKELSKLSIPTIVYIHDVEWSELGGDPRELVDTQFVTNSKFTALKFQEKFGLPSTIIPPLFSAGNYLGVRRPQNVTFVNPIPSKGRELAVEIVRQCPEIPFNFVRSWSLTDAQETFLMEAKKKYNNLTVSGPTRNMKGIYERAAILLVPSQFEEAWGRVVTEAHFSGIPVVASNGGGLPEAVGPGGVLLDPSGPVKSWVNAIRMLWLDDKFYARVSTAALSYSKRDQLNPSIQIDALLKVTKDAKAPLNHQRELVANWLDKR